MFQELGVGVRNPHTHLGIGARTYLESLIPSCLIPSIWAKGLGAESRNLENFPESGVEENFKPKLQVENATL